MHLCFYRTISRVPFIVSLSAGALSHTQSLHLPRPPINSCCARGHLKMDTFYIYIYEIFRTRPDWLWGQKRPPVQWGTGSLALGIKRTSRDVKSTPHLVQMFLKW